MLDFLTTELKVVITSMLPLIELRGAIPIGVALGMSPWHATFIGFLGSMVPVPFILFGIRPIFDLLRKTQIFRKLIGKLTDKSLHVHGPKIQKYGSWGLLVFVAIPLPGTGVWSGSLAAALLDIRFKWAFPAILIGNAIAGVLIMMLSYGVLSTFS